MWHIVPQRDKSQAEKYQVEPQLCKETSIGVKVDPWQILDGAYCATETKN